MSDNIEYSSVDEEEAKVLVPVQADYDSEIEFIPKGELIKIIGEESEERAEEFSRMSDDEKEEVLSNLLIENIKEDPSILDQEVLQCTLNAGVYKLLTFFYIPDSISKTIASWISWFIRGIGSTTYTFLKTSVLYMLTHWQRLLLLVFLNIPIQSIIRPNLVNAIKMKAQISEGIGIKDMSWIIQGLVGLGYTGAGVINVLDLVRNSFFYVIWPILGYTIIEFSWEIFDSLSEINANCVLDQENIEATPKIKKKIEKQSKKSFNALKKTDAVKKASRESIGNKEMDIPEFEKSFTRHVIASISMATKHEISNDYIERIMPTPEEYTRLVEKSSIELKNSTRSLKFATIGNDISRSLSEKFISLTFED